jgi:hypothetical protein
VLKYTDQLSKLRPAPSVSFNNIGDEAARTIAEQLLQNCVLKANPNTLTAVGSVVLQLLMMQLHCHSRQPLFRQPIPWRFVAPDGRGTPLAHDGQSALPATTVLFCSNSYVLKQGFLNCSRASRAALSCML